MGIIRGAHWIETLKHLTFRIDAQNLRLTAHHMRRFAFFTVGAIGPGFLKAEVNGGERNGEERAFGLWVNSAADRDGPPHQRWRHIVVGINSGAQWVGRSVRI
jgi:hypothetical protein